MPQPQAYERQTDFTERDGDDTDHAALNQELDAAALSIEGIRDNLALIQKDDGALKNGIVTPDALAPETFTALQGDVADAVADAQAAATSALTSATTAIAARDAAALSATAAQTSQTAAGLNATAAAASAATASGAQAAVAASAAAALVSENDAEAAAVAALASETAAAAGAATVLANTAAAAASAAAALVSQNAASGSATAAGGSATAALASETAAAGSATAANNSAVAAAASAAAYTPATATPLAETSAGAVGVATKYAREDHSHPSPFFGLSHVRNNRTGSRSAGTTYTGPATKARWVEVYGTNNTAGGQIGVSIAGSALDYTGGPYAGGQQVAINFWVLPGQTYYVSAGAGALSIQRWWETD